MEKTKIDWADSTWNPVTGCLHGCEYCYARAIAERFRERKGYEVNEDNTIFIHHFDGSPTIYELKEPCFFEEYDPFREKRNRDKIKAPYPYGFKPTLHRYRLNDYIGKKTRNIFVCSMADLFGEWVPDEWIFKVFSVCMMAMQHNYLFLTKNPGRYIELAKQGMLPHTDNFWYGSSVTGPHDMYSWFSKDYQWFLSVEPLHEDLGEMDPDAEKPGWIIVGAETGKRKEKIIPQKEWVEKIKNQCEKYGIPLFMKSSLADIWAPMPLVQQFPEKLKHEGGKENA